MKRWLLCNNLVTESGSLVSLTNTFKKKDTVIPSYVRQVRRPVERDKDFIQGEMK